MSLYSSLEVFLKEVQYQVNEQIFPFLEQRKTHPDICQFYELMMEYPLRGGKYLRPAICLLICEICDGAPEKSLNTAIALELMQNWTLIHDDIEDDSHLRRGQPCLHQRYGVPIAVNVGDGLHNKMWELLQDNKKHLGDKLTLDIMSEFTWLGNQLASGQHMELSWIYNQRWDVSQADYLAMCERKTAASTWITPCRLGAMIAGRPPAILSELSAIGTRLGISFQIQDDLLNLIGNESQYGKEIGGDIREGKRTLMLIRLLQHCTDAERQRVIKIMNQPREAILQIEVDMVIDLMRHYKVIAYAQQYANTLIQQACTQFEHLFAHTPHQQSKTLALNLMHFMTERLY